MAGRSEAAGVSDGPAERRATDREVGVVAAILVAGSEKAAAHRLGLSHSTVKHHLANARSKVGAVTTAQLVWILASRLPEPEGGVQTDEWRSARRRSRSHRDCACVRHAGTGDNRQGCDRATTPVGMRYSAGGVRCDPWPDGAATRTRQRPVPPVSVTGYRAPGACGKTGGVR